MAKEREEATVTMSDFDAPASGASLLDFIEEEDDNKEEKDDKDDKNDGTSSKTKDEKSDESSEESSDEKDEKSDESKSDADSEKEVKDEKKEKAEKKEKKEEKKTKAEEKAEEGDDDTFWDDVEKLTGYKVEVDYKGIDPETPEGAALREEAVTRMAIESHMTQLRDLFPREFRTLEHAANGGKMEDLFSPQEPDFSQIEIKEDDVETQKAQLMAYYTSFKGFSTAKARRMVESDEDSEEGLFKASKDAVEERAKSQEKSRQKEEARAKKDAELQQQQDTQMVKSIDEVVAKGELGTFRIPKGEIEGFENFIFSTVQRNPTGGYTFVQPVDGKKLEKQLQAMYFTYKGGDLTKIISTAAETKATQKTKSRLKRQKEQKVSSASETKDTEKKSSMSDFNA